MNLIVVPSVHTKETIERSGTLTTPIIVIPESFPDAFLQDDLQEFQLSNIRTDFNFLIFGQLTGNNAHSDRKNTFFALKWIMEEFSGDKNVGIVLKTNHGRNTTLDRRHVKNIVTSIVRELKSDVPVYLLHGSMTDEEIAGLYLNKKIKALVAPTRGEGYGLPLLEAAAMGLPTIATNWSGHKDFLNHGKWLKLDYTLQEIPESKVDNSVFIKGSKWAQVDEADFKRKLKKFRDNSTKPQEWAKELSNKLKTSHSFSNISKIWQDTIQERLR
jgi:glycosyltransferase involved in cell wall biosynthesis